MSDYDLDFAAYRKLTSLIYAAVLDQSKWQLFLNELTDATGGVKTHLFGFDIPGGISLGLTAAGYSPEHLDTYNSYYGDMNAWAVGFANGQPGAVIPSARMCPRDELFRTEFYNDWVRPQENVAAGGGAILFKDEMRMLAFGGNIRLKDEDTLEDPWLRTVGLLIPHLQQAFEVSRAIAGQSLELDLLRKGRARGGAGMLLLADNGFVLYANDPGIEMLREGDVVWDDYTGRIAFRDHEAASALEGCLLALRNNRTPVAASFVVSSGTVGHNHAVSLIQFEPEKHPVGLFPLVLTYARSCLLMTINSQRDYRSADQVFAAHHGLTAAEMAVVAGLGEGMSTRDLADRRGVSIHTIRNQLKSALFKTGANRQAHLVRMLELARQRAELP